MESLRNLGFVGVGLALALSLAACAMIGGNEDTGSTESDILHGRPGKGIRPVGPTIVPDEDAAPPPSARIEDLDASPPVDDASSDADTDAGPPATMDDDAGEPPAPPPAAAEDAG